MASLTHGHEFELALGVGDGQGGLATGRPGVLQFMGLERVGHN